LAEDGDRKPNTGFIMRLFIALDIDEEIRQRIRTFLEGVRGFAPDARWVKPESLHITLKFIGEQPEGSLNALERALAQLSGTPFELSLRGYGFFPTPKSARVFWIGIQSEAQLSALAGAIDNSTATLGIPKEDRPFSPHLTLARRGGGSGSPQKQKDDSTNKVFQRLSEKLAAMTSHEFGTMTAREFFLYQSQLSRDGSRYTKLKRFPLQGETRAGSTDPTKP
jgi:RNA 2',3'-cyclic 3'-phosphodiesterase